MRLTRQQILAFRRRVGALDERLPPGSESLRQAAWAGLQDSMPRAALLSLHARVTGVESSTWEDPSLAQLWGPRYSTYVVPKRDFALFSLGRYPDNAKGRARAERIAAQLHAQLDGARMKDSEVGRALGVNPSSFRYAATTGTVAIRWDGARAPIVWTVAAAESTRPTRAASSLDATSTSSGRPRLTASPAGRGSREAPRPPRSPRSKGRSWRFERHSATSGCSRRRAGHSRPGDGFRARAPTAERRYLLPARRRGAGASRSRGRISGSCSGRPASGRARSSSKARSAEPGDEHSTPCE